MKPSNRFHEHSPLKVAPPSVYAVHGGSQGVLRNPSTPWGLFWGCL